jgi:hypothetical protein
MPVGTFFFSRFTLLLRLVAFAILPHPTRDLFLFPANGGSPGSLARPRIRACPLSPYGKALAMPEPTVQSQVHQSLDIHGDFTSQITFDLVLFINDPTDTGDLSLGKVVRLRVPVHTGLGQDLLRRGPPDPIDVRQGDFDSLVLWQINAGYSCQFKAPPCSSRKTSD